VRKLPDGQVVARRYASAAVCSNFQPWPELARHGIYGPSLIAPESPLLGVTTRKNAASLECKEFEPRLMLPLDLTYDHRVIDGAEAPLYSHRQAKFK